MELFIVGSVILIYLALVIAGMRGGLSWARRREFHSISTSTILLGVLFIAYAVPFGDHTIGYIYFKQRCDKQAGAKIYRTVSGVDGLLSPTADGQMARGLGYDFVEQGNNPERVTRYEVQGNEIVEHKNARSISRYVLDHRLVDEILWVTRGQYVITDSSTSEELAVYTNLSYRGGWLFRAISSGYSGIASRCPVEPFDLERFIATVLKPTHVRN